MTPPAQLTPSQLSEISHRHPTWPWAIGLVVGCITTCFVTGVAFASSARAEAKESVREEKAQREKDIKAVLEQLQLLRLDAQRNERKLDEVLARLDAQRRGRR